MIININKAVITYITIFSESVEALLLSCAESVLFVIEFVEACVGLAAARLSFFASSIAFKSD